MSKAKGQVNYSRRELKSMKSMINYNKTTSIPMSTRKLATAVAKAIGRPVTGVYYKMLSMSPKRATAQRVRRESTAAPIMTMKKSINFGKPTKIEISESGMTFYF